MSGTVLENIALFAGGLVLARTLGVEQYGLISLLIGITSIGVLASDIGLSTLITRESASIGVEALNGVGLSTLLHHQMCLWGTGFLAAIACALAAAVLGGGPGGVSVAPVVGIWILCIAINRSFAGLFNGLGKMNLSFGASLLVEPSKLGVVIILAAMHTLSASAVTLCWTGAYLFATLCVVLLALFFFRNKVSALRITVPSVTQLREMVCKGFPLFLPLVGTAGATTISIVLLSTMANKAQVAFFSSATTIASISFLVLIPLSQSLLASFSGRFAVARAVDPAEIKLLMHLLAFFCSAVAIGVVVLRDPLVHLTYGLAFAPAATVLGFLIIANSFESFRFLFDPLLQSARKGGVVSVIEALRFLLLIPTVAWASHKGGAVGAAIAMAAISALCLLLRLLAIRKNFGVHGLGFGLRLVAWAGAVLTVWQLGLPPWYVALTGIALSWAFVLYEVEDLMSILHGVKMMRGHNG